MKTASSDPEKSYPFTIVFSKTQLQKNFSNEAEILNWIKEELKFWARLVSARSLTARENDNFLREAISTKGSELKKKLLDYKDLYFPSISILSSNIIQDNIVAAIALDLMSDRQESIPFQHTQQQFLKAEVLVQMYKAFGDPKTIYQQVKSDIDSIKTLRQELETSLNNYDELIEECEKEWSTRIEGYAAKVALAAPRSYWKVRARKHQVLARKAHCQWNTSIILLLIATALLIYFLYFKDPSTDPATVASHTVIFGTLLSITVWWLRQKLRDLRSHEHLAEDAAERVTMIETYAAMKGSGLVDADLSPILNALYRQSTTGLIDDSGPALPIEALFKNVKK